MRIALTMAEFLRSTMLFVGIMALLFSLYYNSAIIALIGLGLIFWGALLFYVRTEEYMKKSLVKAVLPLSLVTLEKTVEELSCKGDAVYLPPRYFEEAEITRIYIPKQKDIDPPTPEQIQRPGKRYITKGEHGILLTPPGTRLSELLEESLGTSFIKVDLEYVQRKLPEAFVQNLEVAENLEIEVEGNGSERNAGTSIESSGERKTRTVKVEITKSVYGSMREEVEEHSQLGSSICCPICSAIAIALAKASNKPVKINRVKSSENGRVTEATYEILED